MYKLKVKLRQSQALFEEIDDQMRQSKAVFVMLITYVFRYVSCGAKDLEIRGIGN